MNTFNAALIGETPALAVVIDRPLTDAQIEENLEYADVAELRADYFRLDTSFLNEQLQRLDVRPRILTIRSGNEGGQWEGFPSRWHHLYEELMVNASAVDVELASSVALRVIASARTIGRAVILSHHDFIGTNVSSLEQRFTDAKLLQPDFYKFACRVSNSADFRALANFVQSHSDDKIIASPMARNLDLNKIYRAMIPIFGSKLVYASAIGSKPVVDGMPNVVEMRELLDLVYPEKQ